MKTFRECWQSVAASLFSQALAGEPSLEETTIEWTDEKAVTYCAQITGDVEGEFGVFLSAQVLESPLVGEGIDQSSGWEELLREVAEAAAGKLLAESGRKVRVTDLQKESARIPVTHVFRLVSESRSWLIGIADGVRARLRQPPGGDSFSSPSCDRADQATIPGPGAHLLVDVELEATLRFGCREMPLSEVMDLGPGDVVELDRQVVDPVDLVVGDKIVARGEVVLVNGNFGLRVTEVAEPRKRLESIRCLF